jgi:hypothetical protein
MNRYLHQLLSDVHRVPVNDLLLPTPVFALLLVMRQVPGAPDDNRSLPNEYEPS